MHVACMFGMYAYLLHGVVVAESDGDDLALATHNTTKVQESTGHVYPGSGHLSR